VPGETALTSAHWLAAYYLCYFGAIGILEPFLAPLWRAFGFAPAEIGALAAVPSMVAILAPFLWTVYADTRRSGERIFLRNTAGAAGLALLLPLAGRPWKAGLILGTLALVRAPLIPLANSMAFRALDGRRVGYAAIRLWGTAGYVLTALAAGLCMDRIGLRLGVVGAGLALGGAALVARGGQTRAGAALNPVRWPAVWALLQDRRLLVLVTATTLARLSCGPYDTFFSIHLEERGFSRMFMGTAWALAASSELALMLGWARLARPGSARRWLIAALAAHPARWLLAALVQSPLGLLAIQCLHALTFGALYLAAVERVDELAPDGLRATAQGLFASCAFGIGGALGSLWAGALFEPLGMRALYLVAAGLALGATLLGAGEGRLTAAGAPTPPQGGTAA
jgi:MFS transporter, PPP family, 3-phenylpropionic acid transporter